MYVSAWAKIVFMLLKEILPLNCIGIELKRLYCILYPTKVLGIFTRSIQEESMIKCATQNLFWFIFISCRQSYRKVAIYSYIYIRFAVLLKF